MALNVDVADVELLVAGLSEAGIEPFEITPRNSVFISDPDGHRIEMLPIISASERDHERRKCTRFETVANIRISPLVQGIKFHDRNADEQGIMPEPGGSSP